MKPGMRLLLLSSMTDKEKDGMQDNYSNRRETMAAYDNYEPADAMRRRRYKNGRFAPMRSAYDAYDNYEAYDEERNSPRNEDSRSIRNYTPASAGRTTTYAEARESRSMPRIGFSIDSEESYSPHEFRNDYRAVAEHKRMDESKTHKSGKSEMGHGSSSGKPEFGKEQAEEWVKSMRNADGSTGAHWSLEQIKPVMAQKNIQCDPYEFYAVVNMLYSDYSKVFRKYGIGEKPDFYAELAKAFIDDEDAAEDKVALYYECIVEH